MQYFRYVFFLLPMLIKAISFEEKVEQYLLKHPEVVAKALALNDANIEREKMQTVAVIQDEDIVIGSRHSKNILFAFIDYRCGACKKTYPMIESFVASHNDFSLVIRPLPILGSDAVAAALLMYDANKEGIERNVSRALFNVPRPVDRLRLYEIAERFNLRVTSQEDSPAHWAFNYLGHNYQQSTLLDNQAVPMYILKKGDAYRLFKGLSSVEALNNAYNEMK